MAVFRSFLARNPAPYLIRAGPINTSKAKKEKKSNETDENLYNPIWYHAFFHGLPSFDTPDS